MSDRTTRNILAILLTIGFLVLRSLGINHVTEWLMISIAGAYGLIPLTSAGLAQVKKFQKPPPDK